MRRPTSLLLGLIFALGLLRGIAVAQGDGAALPQPRTWQRWEHELTSSRIYTNPYAEVVLGVTFSGPGNRNFRGYGFWDGGQTFRIRCAFPAPGTWHWQTECSDSLNAGLHRQSGSIIVSPYTGGNPLYQHGFLRVSDNRRYVAFGDGTPFLWIGDTAWAAPMRASSEEWEQYIADRASKHFTVIQVAPASEWAGGTRPPGPKAFHRQNVRPVESGLLAILRAKIAARQ